MPKIVDHDSQRAKFANAVIRLVAREGLEGLTMRAVAAEAGLSYGSLFHYFESKDELLMHAIRHSTSEQARRVNAFSVRFKGLKALEQLMCDDALVDEGTRDDSLVWLAFLYTAALKEPFADMHAELISGWVERITQLLKSAQERDELRPGLDIEFEALAIWVYSAGIGQQGLLHPAMFPSRVQKKLITAYLDKLRK
ncbi:MAG: TetR family transcriptional regulator [Xanthomonadales bacterium]|nr:TetR family transcriptional regulator C-terminal domain-containing protein [Gammaproteobacteria bacterium]MBT8053460.1 TetR family transcriptional regulator C-terminal domain-containing protein [Gammaproteobacteria bacterium]NND58213.1 TetR family transcriptional regulator [Xanthomonadales bacterium]NNK50016.1 TetR family transcriptional regulator [Xanthomonadales bacterium]